MPAARAKCYKNAVSKRKREQTDLSAGCYVHVTLSLSSA